MIGFCFLGFGLLVGFSLVVIVFKVVVVIVECFLSECFGYKVFNVKIILFGFMVDLLLVGCVCNIYGMDLEKFCFEVIYEIGKCFVFF